jgi:2-succinyl-6-hydroxy-2,4-cyclohexadiene-1-carboxylate synthase
LPGHGASAFVYNPSQAILDYLEAVYPKKHFHLLGYSMGGRIALRIADKSPFCSSIVLLSAHTGLRTQEEKEKRLEHDLLWVKCLREKGLTKFLEAWYEQPLFASLKRIPKTLESLLKERVKNDASYLIKILKNYSLSFDPYREYFPLPTLALYGELDEKYAYLYTHLPKNVAVSCIKQAGHAVHLEKPQECVDVIKKFFSSIISLDSLQKLHRY